MNPKTVKKALKDAIQAMTDYKWLFSARPGKDNTRNRKFPFQKVIPFILAFRGGTLNHEIMDFFGLDPSAGTSSAFIQRRSTILPEAFESLFHDFSRSVDENKLYRGLRLLAVDGSDLQIAANPKDPDSYYPGVNGQRAYNLLHINAMYDLHRHILKLTNKQSNEVKELLKDKNHYRHITNTIRFDYLPRTSRKYDPAVFFELHFRIVRFPISDTACETIITNLDASAFPLHDIKRLYAMRWGIETSFRNLKHTLGLLHLHAKKVEFVLQEIFAKLTMYNFCELITQSVVIRQAQKTHTYKVNFSDAVHICRQFFLGDVPPPILEAMLMRYISPIRPGRKDTRKLTQKSSASFTYRVA